MRTFRQPVLKISVCDYLILAGVQELGDVPRPSECWKWPKKRKTEVSWSQGPYHTKQPDSYIDCVADADIMGPHCLLALASSCFSAQTGHKMAPRGQNGLRTGQIKRKLTPNPLRPTPTRFDARAHDMRMAHSGPSSWGPNDHVLVP